jgi:hypothetical protein
LDRGRGIASSGRNEVAMNHFVTFGFVFLLASLALAVVLDADLALRRIDRLVQSEVYSDMQNVTAIQAIPNRPARDILRYRS